VSKKRVRAIEKQEKKWVVTRHFNKEGNNIDELLNSILDVIVDRVVSEHQVSNENIECEFEGKGVA